MWRAQIREVVVHTTATATFLLSCIRNALHIAVVVVGPYQRDVVGYAQTGIVDVQRLFVRNEYLWLSFCLLFLIFLQNAALFANHLFQRPCTVFRVCAAFHGFVV